MKAPGIAFLCLDYLMLVSSCFQLWLIYLTPETD